MADLSCIYNRLLNTFKAKTFDDAVDRLSYVTTATLLTFFSIMVSVKQFGGSPPINCLTPLEFNGAWEQYAEDYCFIQNTFFIPERSEIPGDFEDRQKTEIGYYQWVPIVLIIQAFFFYLPSFIWTSLHKQCGLHLRSVISEVEALQSNNAEKRKKGIAKLVGFIEETLETRSNNEYGRFCCCRFRKRLGSMTSMLYICIKLIYIFNIFLQFKILTQFLGNQTYLWGFQTFADLYAGREWQDSAVFPRVTLCKFTIPGLETTKSYTIQCVLSLNVFNEKIYLFIWFWFFFLLITTCINNVFVATRLIFAGVRLKYIESLLASKYKEEGDRAHFKRFVDEKLKMDDILLMRFIENECGFMVTKEICENLFASYREKESEARSNRLALRRHNGHPWSAI